jgi:hypothetical protein
MFEMPKRSSMALSSDRRIRPYRALNVAYAPDDEETIRRSKKYHARRGHTYSVGTWCGSRSAARFPNPLGYRGREETKVHRALCATIK